MRLLPVALLAVAAATVVAQENALQPKEWTVPWERTRPRDPVMDHAGRVWFVGQVGNYALALTWGDQHSTGIYTFRHLRALCQCDACRPGFAGRFPQ